MTQRFKRAYNALVDAYFNDTLECADCSACAVGNIVAAGIGGTVTKVFEEFYEFDIYECDKGNDYWSDIFCGGEYGSEWDNNELCERLFNDTGYPKEELMMVEQLFIQGVSRCRGTKDERNYQGLCAVVEYLCKLDGIAEPETYKAKFAEKL